MRLLTPSSRLFRQLWPLWLYSYGNNWGNH